ncbi:MAG: class I SAM-dependent methyltransferase [Deltaproteobacteria bacterium]|nr:class I SAM-dependent methyltransferase [Deltaproteobacteria bacterium]MCB9787280.1 class I SAM-dependent methyltransferase [Deltaproteobacteria bacterium]
MRDNKSYYDTFAETYDRGRDRGYHGFLDRSEFELVAPFARDREVLEVGCGTGLILARLEQVARRAVGVDLSPGMLARARDRGLDVHEASATALPFDDASFDVCCSFKVLAHVEHIDRALAEMARVTRPGGVIVAEFYNRHSVRTLVKRYGPAGRVGAAGDTHEREVFIRYDSLDDVRRYLPESLSIERVDGIRVLSPAALPFELPVLGPLWAQAERIASKLPIRRFGGFLVVTLRRS